MSKQKIFYLGIIGLLFFALIYTNKASVYSIGKKFLKKLAASNLDDSKFKDSAWGIDISHHQSRVDWDELVEFNKPNFIFLKCTEGVTHQDSKYKKYKSKAKKYNILTGAYHFFSYTTSGKEQALNFIKNAQLQKGDLIPVLDLEYTKGTKKYRVTLPEIKAFCETIKSTYGVYPIIYCEVDYKNKVLDNYFDNFDYWISDFYREPKCEYVFWQFTDNKEVRGIGKIDNNRMKTNLDILDFVL